MSKRSPKKAVNKPADEKPQPAAADKPPGERILLPDRVLDAFADYFIACAREEREESERQAAVTQAPVEPAKAKRSKRQPKK